MWNHRPINVAILDQRPGLIRPAVRDRAIVQPRLEHREQLVAKDRTRDRALREQAGLAANGPRPVPTLHRLDMHPKLLGDERTVLADSEALRHLQPRPLTKRLPLRRQPTALRMPPADDIAPS